MRDLREKLRATKFYLTAEERRRLRRQAADEDRTINSIVRGALGLADLRAARERPTGDLPAGHHGDAHR
jgi:hypothetical protein